MQRSDALARLDRSRVGHLATVRPSGHPHIVPITYALCGETIVTMIDHKPKTTDHLQRLANIEADPAVCVIADEYSDDWPRLWWVRADGNATTHHSDASRAEAIEALAAKYRQYRDRPPHGPLIAIDITKLTWWASTP